MENVNPEVILDANGLPKTSAHTRNDHHSTTKRSRHIHKKTRTRHKKNRSTHTKSGTVHKTTTTRPEKERATSSQLSGRLAVFKRYVNSKFCYYSKPVDNAEMLDVQKKVAFLCQMTILMETRKIRMVKTPHPWHTERVLGSDTLGMFNLINIH